MKRCILLMLVVVVLCGCETINDTVVRQWHKDSGLGRRVRNQIEEGLERRRAAPPAVQPAFPAPPYMDQG